MKSKITRKLNKHLWTVVSVYAIVGLCWIFFSDTLAHHLFTDAQFLKIQLYKGTSFVILTAGLLFIIIKLKNKSIRKLFLDVRQRMKNFQDTFEQTAVGMAQISVDGEWIRANKTLCKTLGYKREELMKLPLAAITHPDDLEEERKKDQKIIHGQLKSYVAEKRFITKTGESVFALLTKSAIEDNHGSIKYLSVIVENITKQKEAERQLRKSLHEKEKLLAEVHHRVKNNLAVVSGLLELQSFSSEDHVVKKILKESLMRIKSIALIHESYYKSGTLSEVSLDEYLEEFVEYIQKSFDEEQTEIMIDYHTESLLLNINQAISCGLLINELLVNAYLHAFDVQKKGVISVKLFAENGKVLLKIKDDGTGLPNSVDVHNPASLGLTIIQTLVKQLNGTISVKRSDGTTFTIAFQKEDKKGSASSYIPDSPPQT